MKISSMLQGLRLVGQAEGDRRTYYVYQGDGPYVVASPNDRGGLNVNLVESEAPEAVARRFKGQRVTTNRLMEQGRRPDLFNASFAALNSLYVMVALGRARKLKRREGRALVFSVRR
jgi:hypothetical protein